MEPTFVVVGLNHRTAAVEVRERFWMSGSRQSEVLPMLSQSEGIEEVLVFSTCHRTEFLAWGDATLAVNSILRLLTSEYDLKLREWSSFYRLVDEHAMVHAFRVACGLDSMCIGEKPIARQVTQAWKQARNTGCTGPHLEAILPKAMSVRRRVRLETQLGSYFVSPADAAVQLSDQIFGSLTGKNVVLLGAGRLAEAVARALLTRPARSVYIVNRSASRARELIRRTGSKAPAFEACSWEDRNKCLLQADLVISATAAPGFVLTAEDMKRLAAERAGHKLVLIDLALPRDVDPAVREIDSVLLYDLEDLERAVEPRVAVRPGEHEAERIVLAEAQAFRKQLGTSGGAPELDALRLRIDEICRQELESFRLEQGPFPKEQDRLIASVTARISNKLAGSLPRELKGLPDRGSRRLSAGL